MYVNAHAKWVAKGQRQQQVDTVAGGAQESSKHGWLAGVIQAWLAASWAPKRRAQGRRWIWKSSASTQW